MERDIPDLDELFLKKLSGSITPAEDAYLEEQLRTSSQEKRAFEELRKIWSDSQELQTQPGAGREKRWDQLGRKLTNRRGLFSNRKVFFRYAATLTAICIVAGIYFFPNSPNIIEVRTQFGETKHVTLPDHSTVVLNSGTALSYDENAFHNERKIILDGEAFFNVQKKNVPFTIAANGTVVRVLGTTFNVWSRNDITAVTCLTGKVSLGKGNKTTLLTKGTGATITGDALSSVYTVPEDTAMLWLTGTLSFNNTPLKEAFAELERHFNASITVKRDLGTLTFTGRFKKPTLRNVIETVCLSAGLEYKINNKEVLIE